MRGIGPSINEDRAVTVTVGARDRPSAWFRTIKEAIKRAIHSIVFKHLPKSLCTQHALRRNDMPIDAEPTREISAVVT